MHRALREQHREVFLNVADAATPLDRRASSVKWQSRGILDATEEGVAMIVGQRGGRGLWGGLAVKGWRCDDGLSHAVSRLDDCDKTAAIMGLYKTSSSSSFLGFHRILMKCFLLSIF